MCVAEKEGLYDRLLDFFHSQALNPDNLARLWTSVILKIHPSVLRTNGRLMILGDGLKATKSGKKMPAVKLLHPGICPSEQVTAIALRNSLPEFLVVSGKDTILAKFLTDRIDVSSWGFAQRMFELRPKNTAEDIFFKLKKEWVNLNSSAAMIESPVEFNNLRVNAD